MPHHQLTEEQKEFYSKFLILKKFTQEEVVKKLADGFFYNGYCKQFCYFKTSRVRNRFWVFMRHKVAGQWGGWLTYEFPYPEFNRKYNVTDLEYKPKEELKWRQGSVGTSQIIEYRTIAEARNGFLNYMMSDSISFDFSHKELVKY